MRVLSHTGPGLSAARHHVAAPSKFRIASLAPPTSGFADALTVRCDPGPLASAASLRSATDAFQNSTFTPVRGLTS